MRLSSVLCTTSRRGVASGSFSKTTECDTRWCRGRQALELSREEGLPLGEWTEPQKWARSREVEVQTPAGDVGRTERLSVHVGQWPSTWIDEEKRERALEEMRVARERGWIDDPSSWAEEVEEAVDPASVLETRGRLRGGFEAGGFG